MSESQLTIQYPPDLELLAEVATQGVMVASETTDRFSSMDALVEMGFLSKLFCPRAGKVYQFSVTRQGLEIMR